VSDWRRPKEDSAPYRFTANIYEYIKGLTFLDNRLLDGGKDKSRSLFTPRKIPGTFVRGYVDARVIVLLERLGQLRLQ
jgi:hypothetical protein